MSAEHPDPGIWWKHRRRLAYISMLGLFAEVALVYNMEPSHIAAASSLMIAVAWMFGAILGAYIGSATFEDVVKIKMGK
jgi:hypothetical protein